MNWDGKGFETLPDQRLDEATTALAGDCQRGATFSLLALRKAAVPREVWAHAARCITAPRSRSLPLDGSWVLPEGCSGHSAEQARLVLGGQTDHVFLPPIPVASRAGKSTSSSPSPARVQRMSMRSQGLL